MKATAATTAIISYGTRAELQACLSALHADGVDDVIVVDNASPDDSAAMVRQGFPWVKLIANRENRGYGAAANQAVAASSAQYVILLNADVVPEPGSVRKLVVYLENHPAAAIVGPRLMNSDGTPQLSCYPFLTPGHVLIAMSGLNSLVGRIFPLAREHVACSPNKEIGPVPWVKGAVLAIRASAFRQVGGFDESFFLYGEEHDLCFRLWKVGWETHFTPSAAMVHVEGASSRNSEAAVNEFVFGSLIHFYRKHFSRGDLVRLRLVLAALMSGRILRDSFRLTSGRHAPDRSGLLDALVVWKNVMLGRFPQRPTSPRDRR